MSRFPRPKLLVALPALTVALLVGALLGPARERAVSGARVYGGPTLDAPRQTFRVEVVESFKGLEAPVPDRKIRVLARTPNGGDALWSGRTGADGTAEVVLPALPPAPRLEVVVLEGQRELANASVALGSQSWRAGVTERGGWSAPEQASSVRLRVAPARGTFAVPFSDELWLELSSEAGGVPNATIELGVDGGSADRTRVVTDRRGRARVQVTPREHVLSVRARAVVEGAPVTTTVSLPVVPGAMSARRVGDELVVTAPVPRDWAYFALVTERYRVGGGALRLRESPAGDSEARIALPPLPNEPIWAVVSSAVDLASPARVGWPLFDADPVGEPPRTFDVAERLLCDGLPHAGRRELARQKRVRWSMAAACALSLLLALALLGRDAARSRADLARRLRASGLADEPISRVAESKPWTVLSAILAVALGFAVLALFMLFAER